MINFLKQWLKSQAKYFFWTYIPILLTLIFGMFMVNYFRDIAILAIGLFYFGLLVLVFFLSN
ncbi:hypothetical protein BIY26_14865 [Brenneria goodwinii]|uniref:Uncharacterized protein n=1 Tax=Brenneria goodwinii TaxID=1109412 RepID=A0AAE8EML7_9GAMM|nr:hypothetical protein AWC36_17785 [Brenneria goodwinii]RLM21152.1 hypothetical protein BIY26_14865 [Brenneria goodwinii]